MIASKVSIAYIAFLNTLYIRVNWLHVGDQANLSSPVVV
jgi:hypothetical protein